MSVVDLWAAMPLLIIACAAVLVLLAGAVVPGRYTTTVGVVALSLAALWCVLSPPAASPAIGIGLSPFSRFFTLLFSLTGIVTLLYSVDYTERVGIRGEEYPATVLFATFGMVTVSISTNFLILFLGIEGLTFAFYILVGMDRDDVSSAEAALKFLLMGVVAAAFIAFGIALIYAGTGTLGLAPAMAAALHPSNQLGRAGWGLLLMGFAFKISLVPAHLWTPDVYEGAPAPVVGFLSTGSKGASVAALLLLVMAHGVGFLREPLWVLSLLSMVVGNLAALAQTNVKRLLGYSSVAQMGYVVLALLTGNERGYEAVIFYVTAYSAMNLAAFGAIAAMGGTGEGDRLRGAGYRCPVAGAVLGLSMIALAGIPPTAGFMGKFFIFSAALRSGETTLAVVGLVTAAISVFYYLKVVAIIYMRRPEAEVPTVTATPVETAALGLCSLAIIVLGIFPAPLLAAITRLLRQFPS